MVNTIHIIIIVFDWIYRILTNLLIGILNAIGSDFWIYSKKFFPLKKNSISNLKFKNKRLKFSKKKVSIITLISLSTILLIGTVLIYNKTTSKQYWNGNPSNSYAEGDGSAENPYIIKTAEELAFLAYMVDKGFDYQNTYFELANNIYLNKETPWQIPLSLPADNADLATISSTIKPWKTIGNEKHKFAGYFNGNGNTISGLYIYDNDASNYQGLFGYCTENSKISNVIVENSEISVNSNYVGLICGKSDGLIDNCTVNSVKISGNGYVAGIAGEANIIINASSFSYIYNSQRNITFKSDKITKNNIYFGGLSGRCNYLINCVSYCEIHEGSYFSGGLAGEIVVRCIQLCRHYLYAHK